MRAFMLAMMVLAATGCDNQAPLDIPTEVWDLFPFDGERTWRYVNDKAPYNMDAAIVGTEIRGQVNAYAMSFTKNCRFDSKECVTGDEILNLLLSSDPTDGVQLYSYRFDDLTVELRPPMLIAPDLTPVGLEHVTETGGTEWTSVFTGTGRCPSTAANDWQCGVFQLSSNDENGGVPLAGVLYAAKSQGLVALDIAIDEFGLWQDAGAQCTGDCNGEW